MCDVTDKYKAQGEQLTSHPSGAVCMSCQTTLLIRGHFFKRSTEGKDRIAVEYCGEEACCLVAIHNA